MKVNIEEYQYDFHKVIKDGPSRNMFLSYLTKDRSAENLLFIIECDKIYECKSRGQLEAHATHIFNTFVKRGSPSEINLSGPVVRKIEQQMRSMVLVLDSTVTQFYRIFQPAMVSIMNSLEKDSFTRFIRDEEWIKFVRENYAKDMERIAVHQSQLEQMQIGLNDIDRGFMIWRDIQFGQNMFRDGMRWKLIHSKRDSKNKLRYVKSMDAFECKVKFLDDEALRKYGNMNISKHVITLNCSVDDLFTTCFSEKYPDIFDLKSFEENYQIVEAISQDLSSTSSSSSSTSSNRVSNEIDEEMRLHSTVFGQNIDLKIPFGLLREAFYCSTSVHIPELKTYYRVTKPVPREYVLGNGLRARVPDSSKQLMIGFSWMAFEQMNETTCRIIHVFANNLGGYFGNSKTQNLPGTSWLTKTMGSTINKRQIKSFAKKLNDALHWYIDSGRPSVQDIGHNFDITKRNAELLEGFFQRTSEECTDTTSGSSSDGVYLTSVKRFGSAPTFSSSTKLY